MQTLYIYMYVYYPQRTILPTLRYVIIRGYVQRGYLQAFVHIRRDERFNRIRIFYFKLLLRFFFYLTFFRFNVV